jgi:hypothetical protein
MLKKAKRAKKMHKRQVAVYFLVGTLLLASIFLGQKFSLAASNFSKTSDTISSSWPLGPSNHLVRAKVNTAIPGGGKIIVQFQTGMFTIPDGFDFSDIDIATSTDSLGEFNNLTLGPDFSNGQSVVNVATGSAAYVEIVINPDLEISAGLFLEIKLGTNAFYQENGDRQIVNPAGEGSYLITIQSQNSTAEVLDEKAMMIATVNPVILGANNQKLRFNGFPTGSLVYETTATIISLMTNYRASCRYFEASGTPFDLMTNSFLYTGAYYHSKLISGLTSGRWYNFYVRCWDLTGLVADDTDYLIRFYIMGLGEGEGGEGGGEGGGTGEGSGTGTGSNPDTSGGSGGGAEGASSGGGRGGGGGGGSGGAQGPSQTEQQGEGLEGESPYPSQGLSRITLEGLAYPGSEVNILKDGVASTKIKSDTLGQFKSEIKGLKEGTYTFNLWAFDSENRRSATKSITIWIKENTNNSSRVFIPPTLDLNKITFNPGDQLVAIGQTAPENKLETWITSLPGGKKTQKISEADLLGKWSLTVDTKEFPNGGYQIKTRAENTKEGLSDFSSSINFGIGQPAPSGGDTCSRSDINQDKKINLIDFSILLYNWGKLNSTGDINLDGKVNLVDFSLMMYCWTG